VSTNTVERTFLVRERTAWVIVVIVWAGYLVLYLLGTSGAAHTVAKGLLMPALLLWVLAATAPAAPRLLVAGLVLATVGDVGLRVEFLVGMAGFLVMQVLYVIGFVRLGAWPRVRSGWPVALGYLVFAIVANALLGPRLGELQIPVLVYSIALCTMAIFAAGVSGRVGLGGLLFLVSDMLIGVGEADLDFAGRGLIVLVTYLAAQYLIATGWVRVVRPDVTLPL
jgi:uncharacterized membrane protein YhhN